MTLGLKSRYKSQVLKKKVVNFFMREHWWYLQHANIDDNYWLKTKIYMDESFTSWWSFRCYELDLSRWILLQTNRKSKIFVSVLFLASWCKKLWTFGHLLQNQFGGQAEHLRKNGQAFFKKGQEKFCPWLTHLGAFHIIIDARHPRYPI